MRLGIMIRDAEYREALVRRLSLYDNNLFVAVIDGSSVNTSGCLILTDMQPGEFDESIISRLKGRVVFLSDSGVLNDKEIPGLNFVFKYSSVSSLISELSAIYNEWHGTGPGRNYTAKIIAVCSENDSYSADKSQALARQVIYRQGGNVLLMSLAYINDYGTDQKDGMNNFARLLYSVSSGRGNIADCFTSKDSFDISYLMLPPGRNPAAYLEEDELRSLISGLASGFDSVILDIATCFRKENTSIMKDADSVIYFSSGRRVTGFPEIAGSDAAGRVINIKISDDGSEALAIDDCIRRIYANGKEKDIQG